MVRLTLLLLKTWANYLPPPPGPVCTFMCACVWWNTRYICVHTCVHVWMTENNFGWSVFMCHSPLSVSLPPLSFSLLPPSSLSFSFYLSVDRHLLSRLCWLTMLNIPRICQSLSLDCADDKHAPLYMAFFMCFLASSLSPRAYQARTVKTKPPP